MKAYDTLIVFFDTFQETADQKVQREQTQQIATAAEEQSSVALDISQNVHAVQDLTNESAEIAKSTNAASMKMYDVSQVVVGHLSFFKV